MIKTMWKEDNTGEENIRFDKNELQEYLSNKIQKRAI